LKKSKKSNPRFADKKNISIFASDLKL